MNWELVAPLSLAFLVAAILAVLSYWLSGRLDFVWNSKYLWILAIFQGGVADAGFLGFDWLVESKVLDLGALAHSSPLVKAGVMGVTARWLSFATIFEFGVGAEKKSVGMRLLVDALELRIAEDESAAVWSYVEGLVACFASPLEVRDAMKNRRIPRKTPEQHAAFLVDLKSAQSVRDACEQCLRFCGKRICDKALRSSRH